MRRLTFVNVTPELKYFRQGGEVCVLYPLSRERRGCLSKTITNQLLSRVGNHGQSWTEKRGKKDCIFGFFGVADFGIDKNSTTVSSLAVQYDL